MSDAASTVEAPSSTIPCTDPATGEKLGEAPAMTPDEVRECIARGRRAQEQWATTSFAERKRVLRHLMDSILERSDELCESICQDSGKTLHNAMLGEIWPICEKIRWTIANGEKHLRPEKVSSGLLKHKKAQIEFHPRGVIGVICPWNFPLQNILGPTIPALFAGNAVVVKVSEWVSWSAPIYQELIDRVLLDCGYPTELVQLITGYGDTGAALVSGGADQIVFTGSMGNGKRVVEESSKTLTPVILELGGKDPLIVCDDAQLDQAAHAAVNGCFISSGQMCLATERILVFDEVYDAFVERVCDIALRLRQGAPLSGKLIDVGAMTMPAQLDIVQALVDDAVEKGATAKVGGKRARGKSKQFFQPTILVDVKPDMKIWSEETFGPIMAITRVQDEDEAIRYANDTSYGLSSSIFTLDPERGRRIADRIKAGSTCVNDFALMYMVQDLPFGGVGGSGYGRLNGAEGLRACCNSKSVIEDRIPIHRPNKLFPGKRGDYELTREALRVLYGSDLKERFNSAIAFGKTLLRR